MEADPSLRVSGYKIQRLVHDLAHEHMEGQVVTAHQAMYMTMGQRLVGSEKPPPPATSGREHIRTRGRVHFSKPGSPETNERETALKKS